MCILVVEDEELIRSIVAEELVEAGFEVCEAENGDRAAHLIENPPADFCLLVTDVHMPGSLNGIAVARLMRARYPEVPIIYTTGRPDVVAALNETDRNAFLLPKPYTPSALLKIARKVVASGEPPSASE